MKRILKIAKVFFQLKYKEIVVRPYKSVAGITKSDIYEFFCHFPEVLLVVIAIVLFVVVLVLVIIPIFGLITFIILPASSFASTPLNGIYELLIALGFCSWFFYALAAWLIARVYKFIKSNIKKAIRIVDGKN